MPGLEPEVADAARQLTDQLFLFEQRADCRVVRAPRGVAHRAGKGIDRVPGRTARRQSARERDIGLRERRMDWRVTILTRRVHVRAGINQQARRLVVSRPDRRVQRRIAAARASERSDLSGPGPAGLTGQVRQEVLKVHEELLLLEHNDVVGRLTLGVGALAR